MILIVDANSVFAKWYYGYGNTGKQGVTGFYNELVSLHEKFKPTEYHLCFDGKGNWRKQLYPAYKANRPPKPEDYMPQLEQVYEIFSRSFCCYRYDGYEADDCVYACATLLPTGFEQTIVSADKDMLRLVCPGNSLYMKNQRLFYDDVKKKLGFPPENHWLYQALVGDTVDNVPGVPKIGAKRAKEICQGYFGMVAHSYVVESAPPKYRKLLAGTEKAYELSLALTGFRVPPNFELRNGSYRFHLAYEMMREAV